MMSTLSNKQSTLKKYPSLLTLLSSKQGKQNFRGVQTSSYKDSHSSSEFSQKFKTSRKHNLDKKNNNPSDTTLNQPPSCKAKQSRIGRECIKAQFSTIFGPELGHKTLAEKNSSCMF